MPKFITVARMMAIIMPPLPPSAPPIATNSTTMKVISPTVFTVFIVPCPSLFHPVVLQIKKYHTHPSESMINPVIDPFREPGTRFHREEDQQTSKNNSY